MTDTSDINDDVTEVLYSREQIHERAKVLGARISKDYAGRDLLVVAILKGAAFWMTELSQEITLPCEFDFMAVSSYGSSAKSSGVVRIIKDLNDSIEGRDVLIVEDVLDSGITLKYLRKNLKSRGPNSVEIAVLLRKEEIGRAHV